MKTKTNKLKEFEVTVGTYVTKYSTETYVIKAKTVEEASEIAEDEFCRESKNDGMGGSIEFMVENVEELKD